MTRCLAGLLCLLGLTGCACRQGPAIVSCWADCNTLGTPAVFWETLDRRPPSAARVQTFRWMYGADAGCVLPATEYVVSPASSVGVGVPPEAWPHETPAEDLLPVPERPVPEEPPHFVPPAPAAAPFDDSPAVPLPRPNDGPTADDRAIVPLFYQ